MDVASLRRVLRLTKLEEKSSEDGPVVRRLGWRELGPYAYESRMPVRLLSRLEHDPSPENETTNLIPTIAHLLRQDNSVKSAYLCDASVSHIAKLPSESPVFCGYRNIQMLTSYLVNAPQSPGHEQFAERVPTIIAIQDLIEQAWDHGINADSRQQTGGIRGTRKFIGTPEAQALFRHLSVPCRAGVYSRSTEGQTAYESLLDFVQAYFCFEPSLQNDSSNNGPNVVVNSTPHPPIFLQRPHHSITIIGFEKRKDGTSNLLIFDPSHATSKGMKAAVQDNNDHLHPIDGSANLLQPYRYGTKRLGRYKRFEVLALETLS